MTLDGANLCQRRPSWPYLAIAGSLVALLFGCGTTSRDPTGADQSATGGAGSPMEPTAGTAGTAGSGEATATGGDTEGGGAAGSGGAAGNGGAAGSGGGGVPAVVGGGGAGSSQCAGEAWPQSCAPVCEKPMAGCLLTDADQLPTETVSIEAQVVSAEALDPSAKAVACIGFEAPATPDTSATLISLKDKAGKAWSLWFPTGLVLPARFAQGTTLKVSYLRQSVSILAVEERLVVSEADQVELFVAKTSRAFSGIDDVDLAFADGEQACPWTAGACSEARAHVLVKSGSDSVTDPCGDAVGGFSVSGLAHLASGRRCGSDVCDIASRCYSAGVRIEQ